ncbi:Sister chromatid cohesion 1 protein 1 [Glycine soja]
MLWGTGRFGAPSGSSYFATFVRYHWRVCLLLAALPLHIAFGGLIMFYSHQLLARKAPLGQIWMAATMHAKINRRKLDKLNIIKICEEILNPSIPMALRLSGILMEDVTRFLVEINEAWKVKTAPDPTLLPKSKSKAKKEAVTLPGTGETNMEDIEQSLQFSNTGTTTGFQHNAYFTMRLDNVDEPFTNNGAREDQDQSELLHQVDAENITLFERFETFQANTDTYNRFERFDIEEDEETQVNVTSGDQILTTLVPSPPHQDEPTKADTFQDHHPGHPDIQQPSEGMIPRQEPRRRGPNKRKRGQPSAIEMDYEQTIIPAHIYQHWLQNASDIVSRRGRRKKQNDVMSSTKIASLMKLPPVVQIDDLFTAVNDNIYYPKPILDLWIKSIQPPHDSPSGFQPTILQNHHFHRLQEYKMNISCNLRKCCLLLIKCTNVKPSEDFDGRPDYQAPPMEKAREHILMDELTASLLRGHEATPQVSSGKAGGSVHSFPRPTSENGPASHSDFDSGRTVHRFKNKRYSSSANSSGGLEPLAEDVNFKLARLYEDGPTPDQELLVETGPTQTQVNINHPSDKITDSIQAQMKAHFDTPGAPPVESLHILAAGMTRTSAAQLFYQICVLASRDALKVDQKVPYGEILFSRGLRM